MRKGNSQNIVVRVFTSRFFLFAAFVIATVMAVSFARAYYKDYEVRGQIKALQAEVAELEAQRLESLELLDYVKTDTYAEDVGRTQLGLKKEGERVIIIDAQEQDSSTQVVAAERGPTWRKWWEYFFER